MSKSPEPWYWEARKGYYANVEGRRYKLVSGPERDPRVKAAAHAKLVQVLDRLKQSGDTPLATGDVPTVAWVVSRYIRAATKSGRAESSIATYNFLARSLAKQFRGVPARDITQAKLREWLDRPNWNCTSRSTWASIVKAIWSWAFEHGYIPSNPLVSFKKDTPRRREKIPEPEECRRFLAEARKNLKDFLTVIYETGCRPGEAAKLTAAMIDWDAGTWTMDGKSTKKTGRQRVVLMSPVAREICLRLARKHPEGLIFRNRYGNPWGKSSLSHAVRKVRARAGLGPHVTAGSLRHLFATDALAKSIPVATVATLLGHVDTTMVMRTYGRLINRTDHLHDAIRQIRGAQGSPGSAPPPRPPGPDDANEAGGPRLSGDTP